MFAKFESVIKKMLVTVVHCIIFHIVVVSMYGKWHRTSLS